MAFQVPNRFRVLLGEWGSDPSYGNNGAFRVPVQAEGGLALVATVIASDGEGWEHVSVSLAGRCPTWDEMCQIKALFWGAEDCVIQYHPPASEYVNAHPYCLHLWRPVGRNLETPPTILVGPTTGRNR